MYRAGQTEWILAGMHLDCKNTLNLPALVWHRVGGSRTLWLLENVYGIARAFAVMPIIWQHGHPIRSFQPGREASAPEHVLAGMVEAVTAVVRQRTREENLL